MNRKATSAIGQIFILVVALFAFAFILNEASFVSAEVKDCLVGGGIGDNAKTCPADQQCGKKYTCVDIPEETEEPSWAKQFYKYGTGAISGASTLANFPDTVKKGKEAVQKVLGNVPDKIDPLTIKEGADVDELYGGAGKAGTRLFGRSVYWTSAKVEAGIDAGLAPAGETAHLFGGGAIKSSGTIFGGAMTVVVYAAVAYAAFNVGKMIGMALTKDERQANSIGAALGGGVFTALAVSGSGTAGAAGAGTLLSTAAGATILGPFATGAIVAVAIYFLAGSKTSYEVVRYQCLPYVAPTGGDKCEECNGGDFPCTEYQCASLGRACELVNKGTDNELCVELERTVVPPTIMPWEKPLPDGYIYNPLTTNFPKDRGVKIINENTESGCLPPFTEISFGVTTDSPSICKITDERVESWEGMGAEYIPKSGLSVYNHSTTISFPDKASLDAAGFESKEGFNEFFVRCEGPNGNRNEANFVFRYCVDESPDLTTPLIKFSSPLPNSPIKFNMSEIDAMFYLDKPSDCKWDHLDRTYDDMENTMSCAQSIADAVPYQYSMVYPCRTTVDGLANYVENDIYVRCKSYPEKNESERVEMGKSFEYTLRGTRPLTLNEVGPNETIKSASEVIQVQLYAHTLGGSDEGDSMCYFSQTDEDSRYLAFFNSNSYEHTQDLWLGPGAYSYYIKCVDAGGNIAKDTATFVVEADTVSPLIARAYNEDGYLKLATNEEATCSYSVSSCEYAFEDGIQFDGNDLINHYTVWDTTSTLYVKCEDIFNNRPLSENECSIIVRPYDEFHSKVE
jgi:hypothetical protein